MPSINLATLPLLLLAAFIAGAINAVAGGGTLFSFTALGLLIPLKNANATNSALLTPASLISALAFLKELRSQWRLFLILLIPTLLGSYAGATTLINTSDEAFRRTVPFLILFAVMLFAFKDQITQIVKQMRGTNVATTFNEVGEPHISPLGYVWGIGFQFITGFYGGYFGAGIGILMISSFSLMGLRDMHRMNALKNPLAFMINGVAAVRLFLDGLVILPLAIPMSIAAMAGGYISARMSRRINQKYLRRFVIIYGFVIAVYMFARYWLGWLA